MEGFKIDVFIKMQIPLAKRLAEVRDQWEKPWLRFPLPLPSTPCSIQASRSPSILYFNTVVYVMKEATET
jgi:hypothetical protein